MSSVLGWALWVLAAFVAGAIPFGLIIGKWRGVDVRLHGSKNIGATNVGRVLGRKCGLLCFALDFAKGALPVLGAGLQMGTLGARGLAVEPMIGWLSVVLAAVLGHMFTPLARFKGGKGVATGFGALVAFYPALTWPVLVAFALWLIVVRLTRYVSVASCMAAASIPLSAGALALATRSQAQSALSAIASAWPLLVFSGLLAGIVVWKHRTNLARVRAGTENKVGGQRVLGGSP